MWAPASDGRMSSTQAIQAVQMFTKHGASKKVSVVKEIVIGVTIGLGFGVLWKVLPASVPT